MSSGFFGLLRNLRPAMRAGPDFDVLFAKLGCSRCFENDGASYRGMTAPNFDTKQTKLRCTPRFGNDGVSRQMVRQHHSLKTETARMELAPIRAVFVFRRIFEALFASRPFHQQAETTKIDTSTNIAG